jgi:hypothetical protein
MWDSKQVVNQWYPKKQHWWLAVPTTESHTARYLQCVSRSAEKAGNTARLRAI